MILRPLTTTVAALLAFALPVTAAPTSPRGTQQLRPRATEQTDNTTPAVCTPNQCLVGTSSLAAGTTVSTPLNSTSSVTTLLPGTYTSSSSVTANSSHLSFERSSTVEAGPGFTTSGTLGSAFTVSLQPGVTSYTASLFAGSPSYTSLSDTGSISTADTTIKSFLLSENVWAILQVGGSSGSRVVAWDGVADVGNIAGGAGGVSLVQIQSSGCVTPCASGGTCAANSTCTCYPGFTGSTCNACAEGFFGGSCEACPIGCLECDSGITGTGTCLDSIAANATSVAEECNCINGVCDSAFSSATCGCNSGWGTAANGTQCAACATGYYSTASGDCLACDPSCASCSGPEGVCLTCQTGLQPLSTDASKCTTATTASSNGTFITCPDRTFFDSTTSACVACNPLCDTCWATGTGGCLTCRSPNGLLDGECVAYSTKTGVCDSSKSSNGTVVAANAAWVYDNSKSACDALPAKCTAGGIDNFSATSTRSQLTCSACLAGSVLVDGACIERCPDGLTLSEDGKDCSACDSTCGTCSGTSSSDCITCSDSSRLLLNGTCITGPSCPTGFFASTTNTTTCLACHPDCQTCGTSFDQCLSCPPSRPVLSAASTCLLTCSSDEYFDTAKGACVKCSSGCETCSGPSTSACLSCSSTTTLKGGTCVATTDNCAVVPGFGVCLASLVAVAAESSSTSTPAVAKFQLPWYTIMVIILVVLALVGLGVWYWRKKEQKRRRLHTARFADELGNKEVRAKLAALEAQSVTSYPPHSHVTAPVYGYGEVDIPLTPRFVIGDAPSPTASETRREQTRWSMSSYGSKRVPVPLVPQETGGSSYSQRSALTSASGKRIQLESNNPFARQ